MWTAEFWDERYASSDKIWSGQPNRRLVEQTADLVPGTALDVGAGEGADAIWLAQRGWSVTGIDLSQVALDRATTHAAAAGVSATFRQHDVLLDPVVGGFDLVTAHFMHVLRPAFDPLYVALAAAVRPGGTLLVVGHHPHDVESGVRTHHGDDLLFDADRVTALLDPADWDVLVADAQSRPQVIDGEERTVTDTVVRAVRKVSAPAR